jgi:hypothetical protein
VVATVLSPIYPIAAETLFVGRELVTGTPPTTGYVTMPVVELSPDPKQDMLPDNANRGAITTGPYDLQPGPYWAESQIKDSPLFGDTIGHVLFNIFGDLVSTGTASTPTWTTSGALAAGATSIPVVTGAAAVQGTYVQVGTASGTTENVMVGTGSTTTSIVLSALTPLRFSHLTAITITTIVAPFTHVFSLLNPASSTGSVSGQPPTHSIGHRNQTAGSGGNYADLYSYGCFSEVKLSGAASGLLMWSGNLTSYGQQAPASAFTPAPSGVHSIPSWKGISTIAGSPVSDVSNWGITLTREIEPIPTIDGQQAPSVIARGGLSGSWDLSFMPAIDQSALNNYLSNTQPTFLWTTSNGLSGASQVSISVAAQLAGFTSAKLTKGKTVYGYDTSGDLIVNTTDAGNSGGFSPCQVTLINSVGVY